VEVGVNVSSDLTVINADAMIRLWQDSHLKVIDTGEVKKEFLWKGVGNLK